MTTESAGEDEASPPAVAPAAVSATDGVGSIAVVEEGSGAVVDGGAPGSAVASGEEVAIEPGISDTRLIGSGSLLDHDRR
jgi:hypothetical protein